VVVSACQPATGSAAAVAAAATAVCVTSADSLCMHYMDTSKTTTFLDYWRADTSLIMVLQAACLNVGCDFTRQDLDMLDFCLNTI
jgi:hypothetical protein